MESHNSNKRASGSTFVLVSGTLSKSVQSKISKTGNPYDDATIVVHDGENAQYWKTTALSE